MEIDMLIARDEDNNIWAHIVSDRARKEFTALGLPLDEYCVLLVGPIDDFIAMFPEDMIYRISLDKNDLN